jgi:NDP-sugar pyrophosphorylase family protein
MFKFVIDHFPSRSSIIITTPAIAKSIEKGDCEVHILKNQTKSQYETIQGALNILTSHDDFFLTSCDAYGLFDFKTFREFTRTKRPDAVIFTFKPSLMHTKMSSHHSHVSVKEDRITAVHIKSKNSPNDPGFAGFFWVKEGRIFDSINEVPIIRGSEMLADHVFKYFVDSGMYVASFELDRYIHIGTTEEFLEYRYWRDRDYLFSET